MIIIRSLSINVWFKKYIKCSNFVEIFEMFLIILTLTVGRSIYVTPWMLKKRFKLILVTSNKIENFGRKNVLWVTVLDQNVIVWTFI